MDVSRNDIKTFLYTPGKFFKIPDFQRPYSWDKANILNFLEDLEQVIKTNRKHFFGSIVYINESDDNRAFHYGCFGCYGQSPSQ